MHKVKMKKSHLWQIISGVLLVVLIVSIFTSGFKFGSASVSKDVVAQNTIKYINEVLLQGQATANFVSIEDKNGLYNLKFTINDGPYDTFVTKDGKTLFPQAIDMAAAPVVEAPVEIPKTEKPVVQLFVMSQCPYGVQAENGLESVVELMGSSIDFQLRFIANDNGNGTFSSLHGQNEVDEDIRQICIMKYENAKLWNYLSCVNADYSNIATIWENCAKTALIDAEKIKTCAAGEGKDLFKENIKTADELQVQGSPTLKINGVDYSGARSSDAYKTGICSGFATAPAICESALNATATTATGSC